MRSLATHGTPAMRYTLIAGAVTAALTAALGGVALADDDSVDRDGHFHQRQFFFPDNLVVSRSVYDNNAKNVVVGTVLPPSCPAASGACGAASGESYRDCSPEDPQAD